MAAISVIDYGAGNIRSVLNAVNYLGYDASVTTEAAEVVRASVLVLPGVGAAHGLMKGLAKQKLTAPILDYLASGKPFLGICLGLQVLFDSTEEGGLECLGFLKGRVRRLPEGLKRPHMGWNMVTTTTSNHLLGTSGSYFYFVHSYYAELENTSLVTGWTTYGISFPAVITQNNLVATQFHPEKSGHNGLLFLRNFFEKYI